MRAKTNKAGDNQQFIDWETTTTSEFMRKEKLERVKRMFKLA